MGTYGVTHVKKDNTIITFSDSHDGYLGGGMGESNLICIKHLSTPVLHRLFDQYNASTKVQLEEAKNYREDNFEDEGKPISQREIEDSLFQVEKDTQSSEAVEWMNGVLNRDIRASVCGFAPMLYLNINNHYGRDYSYCDYLVDLDNEIFVFNGVTLPFSQVRSASLAHLEMFCGENVDLFEPDMAELAEDCFDDSAEEPIDAARVKKVVDAYFSIDQEKLNAYFQEREKQQAAWLAEAKDLVNQPAKITKCSSGFSIHSSEIGIQALRNITTFLQKSSSSLPETRFLTSLCEWSVDETFSKGRFRVFSPMSNSHKEHEIHAWFVNFLGHDLKLRMNIYSSSGIWSNSDLPINEDTLGFGDIEGPQRCVFSLEEIRKIEHGPAIFEGLHPYLGIYSTYEEVRPLLLSPEQKVKTPIIWLYHALLNQDQEVFERVYPLTKEQITTLDEKTTKTVYEKLLQGITDGDLLAKQVTEMSKMTDTPLPVAENKNFLLVLQQSGFFEDVSPFMNALEKSKYLSKIGSQKPKH